MNKWVFIYRGEVFYKKLQKTPSTTIMIIWVSFCNFFCKKISQLDLQNYPNKVPMDLRAVGTMRGAKPYLAHAGHGTAQSCYLYQAWHNTAVLSLAASPASMAWAIPAYQAWPNTLQLCCTWDTGPDVPDGLPGLVARSGQVGSVRLDTN